MGTLKNMLVWSQIIDIQFWQTVAVLKYGASIHRSFKV